MVEEFVEDLIKV